MNNFLKNLQANIDGQSYDAAVIREAISLSDTLEVKVLLKCLLSNKSTFQSRMALNDFVVRLAA